MICTVGRCTEEATRFVRHSANGREYGYCDFHGGAPFGRRLDPKKDRRHPYLRRNVWRWRHDR